MDRQVGLWEVASGESGPQSPHFRGEMRATYLGGSLVWW